MPDCIIFVNTILHWYKFILPPQTHSLIIKHSQSLLYIHLSSNSPNTLYLYFAKALFVSIIIFPTRMTNRTNIMSHQLHDWITNERTKVLYAQNKVILPRLTAEEGAEHSHVRKGSLRKKDELALAKSINYAKNADSARYKHKGDSRIDTSKSNTSMTDSALKSSRSEKADIVKEIKSWIKLIENASEDSSSLLEMPLSKLENALYKWCLFIEQNVCCSQKSEHSIPTPHQTPSVKLHRNPEDTPSKSSDSSDSLLRQQREYFQNQIRKLSMRVQQLEEEVEANRIYSKQSLSRIAELQWLFHDWSERVSKQRQDSDAIDAIQSRNEQFLQEIKHIISQGKETSVVVQKIEEKLNRLKHQKHHNLLAF